jgi:DHA1 family bicyclomycin/chloramphenicol resistance-like MFS transporter
MVRDLYEGPAAAQMMSTLMMVMAVAPLLGPLVGGQVLAVSGWRAIFWLLAAVGVATLAVMPTLPETLPPARRDGQSLGKTLAGYAALLHDRRLLAYAGAGGFFYAGMFACIAGSPYVYIVVHHVPPQAYGLLFATGVVGIMAANFLSARFVHRLGSDRLLVWGAAIAVGSGVILAVDVSSGWGGLAGIVVPLFLFASMAGFIVANSILGALSLSTAKAGSVSALIGTAQYGAGVAGSAVLGAVADGTARPMAFVIALSGIGTFVRALKSGVR